MSNSKVISVKTVDQQSLVDRLKKSGEKKAIEIKRWVQPTKVRIPKITQPTTKAQWFNLVEGCFNSLETENDSTAARTLIYLYLSYPHSGDTILTEMKEYYDFDDTDSMISDFLTSISVSNAAGMNESSNKKEDKKIDDINKQTDSSEKKTVAPRRKALEDFFPEAMIASLKNLIADDNSKNSTWLSFYAYLGVIFRLVAKGVDSVKGYYERENTTLMDLIGVYQINPEMKLERLKKALSDYPKDIGNLLWISLRTRNNQLLKIHNVAFGRSLEFAQMSIINMLVQTTSQIGVEVAEFLSGIVCRSTELSILEIESFWNEHMVTYDKNQVNWFAYAKIFEPSCYQRLRLSDNMLMAVILCYFQEQDVPEDLTTSDNVWRVLAFKKVIPPHMLEIAKTAKRGFDLHAAKIALEDAQGDYLKDAKNMKFEMTYTQAPTSSDDKAYNPDDF